MRDYLHVYGYKVLNPLPYPWQIWDLGSDNNLLPATPETHELIPTKEPRPFENDPGPKVLKREMLDG